MEGFGMNCIKYLLFVFNFLFMIAGIGIIVAASITLYYANYNLLEGDVQGPNIALLIIGLIVFFTAFLGCCGAIKENFYMLMAFAVILILIFIAQLAIGITAAVYKDSFQDELKRELHESLNKDFHDDKLTREGWAQVQMDFKCCGVDGPADWKLAGQAPASCCPAETSDSEKISNEICSNPSVIYQDGCYDKVAHILKSGLVVIMGVAIGIAFIELAGAILAFFLATSVRKGADCEA